MNDLRNPKAAEILEKIRKIKLDAKVKTVGLYAQLEGIQMQCKHPNGFETSCMGDPGYYCPDCGYSR